MAIYWSTNEGVIRIYQASQVTKPSKIERDMKRFLVYASILIMHMTSQPLQPPHWMAAVVVCSHEHHSK